MNTPIYMNLKDKMIDLWKISPDDLSFDQIANSLAKLPRWAGHNDSETFPVSKHCVLMSYLVPPEFALEALLHDAAEFLLGDIPSPIKHSFPDLIKLENVILTACFKKYLPGFNKETVELSEKVKKWDEQIRMYEYWTLFGKVPPWAENSASCYNTYLRIKDHLNRIHQYLEPMDFPSEKERFAQRYLELI